jgi:hypothetical protein
MYLNAFQLDLNKLATILSPIPSQPLPTSPYRASSHLLTYLNPFDIHLTELATILLPIYLNIFHIHLTELVTILLPIYLNPFQLDLTKLAPILLPIYLITLSTSTYQASSHPLTHISQPLSTMPSQAISQFPPYST